MTHILYVTPKQACVEHRTDAPIIAIKEGERGYYPIYSRATTEDLNHGVVSDEVIQSAVCASMFGWDIPAAKAVNDYFASQKKAPLTAVEKRIAVEKKVVRKLIRAMKAHGWLATSVDDGGEIDEIIKTTTETEVMDAVFAVDEAQILFQKGDDGHWVRIILGNDGWDAIADYSYREGGEFVKIMEEEIEPYCDKLSEECP